MKKITVIPCPNEKISIKCPFKRTPQNIIIHNTANDAPARNEITYMHRNDKEASFHFAVDDTEIVQGIDLDRNSWNAGDGRGKGNMEGISIEICYSKSGGEKFRLAQENAAELCAYLLNLYGWGIEKITKHQDYNGKYCPHRTLDDYGWDYFIELVRKNMSNSAQEEKPQAPQKKTDTQIADEVIKGLWGNGSERKERLTKEGYDYSKIQALVNEMLLGKKPQAPEKTDAQVALEVVRGDWGNGNERRERLTAAGYNYSTIQALVNELLK